MNYINNILTCINTFEEFEKSKLNNDLFKDIVNKILAIHHLPKKPLMLFSEGTNVVFSYDNSLVIKLFPPFHQDQFESERLILKTLEGQISIEIPKLIYEGEIVGWPYIIMTQLSGTLLEELWHNLNHDNIISNYKRIRLINP